MCPFVVIFCLFCFVLYFVLFFVFLCCFFLVFLFVFVSLFLVDSKPTVNLARKQHFGWGGGIAHHPSLDRSGGQLLFFSLVPDNSSRVELSGGLRDKYCTDGPPETVML